MNNWMFFPKKEGAGRIPDLAFVLDQVRLSPVSEREWAELVPESRERAQGPSLGFCCGPGLSGFPAQVQFPMPDFPVVPFVSDFIIEPKCWQEKIFITIPSVPDQDFRFVGIYAAQSVITVTSAIPDRPPSFRVCGSYCFFGPPYILAPVPPLRF